MNNNSGQQDDEAEQAVCRQLGAITKAISCEGKMLLEGAEGPGIKHLLISEAMEFVSRAALRF